MRTALTVSLEAVDVRLAGRHGGGILHKSRRSDRDDRARQHDAREHRDADHGDQQGKECAGEAGRFLTPSLAQHARIDRHEGGGEALFAEQVLECVGQAHRGLPYVAVRRHAEESSDGHLA